MATTLVEARKVLTDSVLHVGETDYPADKQDRAIKFALERFLRKTRCNIVSQTFTLTANSPNVDVTGTWSDFMPYQLERARITYDPVELVNANKIIELLDTSTATAQPEMIGWETTATAWLYPIPDSAYTLTLLRAAPLVEFTPGTEANVTLNVPDQFVHDAIWFGASAALVYGQANSLYASTAWQRFNELIEEAKGLCGMGVGSAWKPALDRRSWPTEGARWWPN